MTTEQLPDPGDAQLVDRILTELVISSRIEKLRKLFEGHMHRVMTTTVGGINSVTGLGTDIPDHLARRIIAKGRLRPPGHGHSGTDA